MMILIDRDHDPDHDHIQGDILDHIQEIVILEKEEDIDPKRRIQDRDPVRGSDRPDHETNRIVIVGVILAVEQEVQCVGELHQEELVLKVHVDEIVLHEKCQDEAEVVALNKIVDGG